MNWFERLFAKWRRPLDEVRAKPKRDRRAVTVGVNDHAGSPLRGCVPDALAWAAVYRAAGWEVRVILDRGATAADVRRELEWALAGDEAALVVSSHGTLLEDETAIVLWDATRGDFATGCLTLRQIGAVVKRARAKFHAIIDACHSQAAPGVLRLFGEYRRPRFLPAPLGTRALPRELGPGAVEAPDAKWLVLAACLRTQTAADAHLGGGYCGAFSFTLQRMIAERRQASVRDLLREVNRKLEATGFEQDPVPTGTSERLEEPAPWL